MAAPHSTRQIRPLPAAPLRAALVVVSALLVGGVAGLLEGAVYPPGGPRIHLATYWTLLAIALLNSLYAFAQLLDPHPGRALANAVAVLPLCVVAQDAASLLLQHSSPARATWYAGVFGEHLLTRDLGFAPGFYVVFPALSLALLSLIAWRWPRAALTRTKTATASGMAAPRPANRQQSAHAGHAEEE